MISAGAACTGPDIASDFSSRTSRLQGDVAAPQLSASSPESPRQSAPPARFTSSIHVSRRIRFRLGARASRIGCSPTTARSVLRGNVNWMQARSVLAVKALFRRSRKIFVVRPPAVLGAGGDFRRRARAAHADRQSLPLAMMMMIPEAYEGQGQSCLRELLRFSHTTGFDRALGRPGGRRIHRRPCDRGDARSQRARPGRWLRPLTGGSCSPPRRE